MSNFNYLILNIACLIFKLIDWLNFVFSVEDGTAADEVEDRETRK